MKLLYYDLLSTLRMKQLRRYDVPIVRSAHLYYMVVAGSPHGRVVRGSWVMSGSPQERQALPTGVSRLVAAYASSPESL